MDGTVITKKGMQLLVKLIATKGVLEFTRVSVGTGVMKNGYDPASMTDLIQYKMDGMISECEADGDIAKITMQISSVGIETGFTMTEMGVFADDPDLGEILYAYLDMREDPQYIYAEGGTAQKFVEVTLDVAIEEATKVTTYINPKSMITRKEFEEVTGNVNVTEKGSLQNQIGRLEEKSESVQNQIDQIKNGDAPVIFEDYTSDELDIPDPEYAINQITSGKSSKLIQQYIKAALKGLLNLAQRALNIATGRNQARVFATVAALDAWLAVPDNVKQLNVGDNFYITATDVPDYWWDGIQKQKLETQKVDLTTYDQRITANASAISELNGNISAHNHDGRYLPPVWENYDVSIAASNFQGNIYLYKRNGSYKQIVIMGSLTANLAADTGGRYIGSIPDGAMPEVYQVFPGITKKGKTIWITIDTNGAVNVENYSLNAAVLERNDYFYVVKVYY